MPENTNIKWEKMLTDVMKEGKSIKKRRLIIGSSVISFTIILFAAFLFVQDPEKKSAGELIAENNHSNEIEVALISNDAFFDNDLELLIY